MSKHLIYILIVSFISLNTYAQVVFEKGYFINSTGNKVECLIKNVDWKNNPATFQYKLSVNDDEITATLETAKEFEIFGASKYIAEKVNIDKSSDNINKLTDQREPSFESETLFLKVLVEGNASLFYYEDGNLKRYFFQIGEDEIQQLVYRRYYVNDTDVTENLFFRQQLYLQMECEEISPKTINNLSYKEKDLKNIFIDYNRCTDASYKVYERPKNKDPFNLTIRPGINYHKLQVFNTNGSNRDIEFSGDMLYRLGIEAELFMSFNKNKWSLIAEPTYQYFNGNEQKESSSISGGILKASVSYQSIELPIGLRYYMFLNNSKVFTNLSVVLDFNKKSQIEYTRNDGTAVYNVDIDSGINLAFGIGYKYKKRLSTELRIHSNRDLLSNYIAWYSKYSSVSLIVGYTLF